MIYEDYYKILQVDPAAEPEVIAAAYRRLAQKYHPDAQPDPSTTRRMHELNTAYQVLSDPNKRMQYDQTRSFRDALPVFPGAPQTLQAAAYPLASPPTITDSFPAQAPARRWSRRRIAAAVIALVTILGFGTAAVLFAPGVGTAEPPTRVWDGECRDPSGFVFTCRVRLKINRAHRVTGAVIWTLRASPRTEDQLSIGRQGRASVRGTYDPASRQIKMGSHSQDDPFDIINANEYELTLSPDDRTLNGATFDDGVQKGLLSATLKE